jgi:hypothetical protein
MDDITKIAQGYDDGRNTSSSNIMPQEGSGSLQDIGKKFQQFAKPIINRSEGGGTPRLARNPHGFELPERNLPKPRSAPAPTPAPAPAPDANQNGLSDYIEAPFDQPAKQQQMRQTPQPQADPFAESQQADPFAEPGGQGQGVEAQGMPAELSDEQQLWQDVKDPLYHFAKTEPGWVMGAQSFNELLGKQRVGSTPWMRQPIYRRPVGGQPFNIKGTQWLNRPATAMARGTRDYALKPIANTAGKTYRGGANAARYLGNKAAPTVIKSIADANKARQAANAANVARSAIPGVNATRAFQAARPLSKLTKALPGISTAVEGGFLLNDIHNKASNPGDNRGAVDRYWDASLAQGHEKGQQVRDMLSTWDSGDGGIGGHSWAAASKAGDVIGHVLSPVSTLHSGIALQQEMAGGLSDAAQGAYNWATDAKGRATKKNISDTQALHRSEAANLGQQAAKLRQSGNLANPAVKAQYDELLAKANDAKQQALAISDETADWNLGNQHYFGSGGHKFRDAMQSSGDAMRKELSQLQSGRNALAPDDPRLENLKLRQRETQRLVDLYGKEVGYMGEGAFTQVVRNRVAAGKSRIIDIAARMREPAVRNNPELMRELSQDLEHHKARMQNYQQWGAAAR